MAIRDLAELLRVYRITDLEFSTQGSRHPAISVWLFKAYGSASSLAVFKITPPQYQQDQEKWKGLEWQLNLNPPLVPHLNYTGRNEATTRIQISEFFHHASEKPFPDPLKQFRAMNGIRS